MKYGKQSTIKKVMQSRITLFVALGLFVFLLKATWNMADRAVSARDRLAQSEMALKRLQDRKDDLAMKVEYLSTDEGIESEIRTKFRAVEEGESVAVIVSDKQVQKRDLATTSVIEKRSFWGRMMWLVGL